MSGNSLSSIYVQRIAARDFGTVTAPAQPFCGIFRNGEWTCKNESWRKTGGQGK